MVASIPTAYAVGYILSPLRGEICSGLFAIDLGEGRECAIRVAGEGTRQRARAEWRISSTAAMAVSISSSVL